MEKNKEVVLIVAFTLAFVAIYAFTVRTLMGAYAEERAHSAFLFDCTHIDRPEACENNWLSQCSEGKCR